MMDKSRQFVFCGRCGEVELSKEEYKHQMMRGDIEWFCPRCGYHARFTRDLMPCLDSNCDGWLDMEKGGDICGSCGQDQHDLYYADEGLESEE